MCCSPGGHLTLCSSVSPVSSEKDEALKVSKQDQVWTRLYQSNRWGGRPSPGFLPWLQECRFRSWTSATSRSNSNRKVSTYWGTRLTRWTGASSRSRKNSRYLKVRRVDKERDQENRKSDLDPLMKKSQLWFMHTTDVKSTDPIYFRWRAVQCTMDKARRVVRISRHILPRTQVSFSWTFYVISCLFGAKTTHNLEFRKHVHCSRHHNDVTVKKKKKNSNTARSK